MKIIFFLNSVTLLQLLFLCFQGLKYRFRIINSGFLNCPIELSVDNHTLLVIASDGADLQPVEGALTYW